MKIKVFEMNTSVQNKILITFSSPYGSAHGFWVERVPEISKSYDVEFDIPQTLVLGKDITKAELDEFRVWCVNDDNYICAEFHSFEDNYLTVRFGKSLIFIETEGEPILNYKFLTTCFRKMNIYPYSL